MESYLGKIWPVSLDPFFKVANKIFFQVYVVQFWKYMRLSELEKERH